MEREFNDFKHGLILTRKPGESVIITTLCPHCGHEEKIKIKFLSLQGRQTRVMYSANRDTVTIHREEVAERIKQEEDNL